MKRIMAIAILGIVLAACGSGDEKKSDASSSATDRGAGSDYQKGVALVAKHRCTTCHTIDDALTGPPYREVAKRYAGQSGDIVEKLAHKIIKGGGGEWGEMPMAPNAGVSQEEAETMVKYILSLNK